MLERCAGVRLVTLCATVCDSVFKIFIFLHYYVLDQYDANKNDCSWAAQLIWNKSRNTGSNKWSARRAPEIYTSLKAHFGDQTSTEIIKAIFTSIVKHHMMIEQKKSRRIGIESLGVENQSGISYRFNISPWLRFPVDHTNWCCSISFNPLDTMKSWTILYYL